MWSFETPEYNSDTQAGKTHNSQQFRPHESEMVANSTNQDPIHITISLQYNPNKIPNVLP